MIKKKLSIYLLLLSVLLFLRLLGTTSYAYNYQITDSDIDLIVDYYIPSSYRSQFKSRLKTYLNDLYNVQNYDTCVIGVNSYSNSYWVDLYGFNSNSVTAIGSSKNVNYMNVTINNNGMKYEVYVNNGNYQYTNRQTWTGGNFGSGSQLRTRYLCVPNDLGNGLFEGPWQSTEILTFTPSEYFDIDINADFRNNRATIKGDTSGTEYYLVPYSSSRIRIGNMFDYHNLLGVVKRKFRYKQSIRDFELVDEFQSDTDNLEYYSIADDTLVVYEYYQADTTEFITFIPTTDSDFEQFTVPIYFTSDYTSITNGVIDNVVTFSGDYYSNYNNDTNTDKIINNTNNDSEVEDMLQNFTSGDFAGNLGYEERENPFNTFILAFVYNVCNRLLSDEDVYWDYSMHGEPARRIYASDFTTPETPLKVFVRLSMTFGALYLVYVQLRHYIELINEGNAAKVLHDVDADVYFYKM